MKNKFFERLIIQNKVLSLFQVWLPIMKMDKKKFKALMSAGANAGLNNRFHLVTTPATSEFCHRSSSSDYIENKKSSGIKKDTINRQCRQLRIKVLRPVRPLRGRLIVMQNSESLLLILN